MDQITFTSGGLQHLKRTFTAVAMTVLLLVTFDANAQTWGYMGTEAGISGGGASFINLAKGQAGTLYMSYYDTSVSKGSVQQYANGAWSYVGGSAGITTGTATYNSLSVDASGTIYYTNQAGWPDSGMQVRSFNGTAWSSLPPVTTAGVNYQASAVSSNGILVAVNGEASGTAKRYVNGAWEQLGAAGFAGGTPTFIKMVAGNNGVVYASHNNGGYVHVSKISDSATGTDAWEAVGTANIGAAASSENYNSALAIDQNNNLYLAYVSGSAGGNKLNVKKYDGTTWTQLGSENFSTGKVQHVSIAVTASGTPYVVASNWEDADFLKNYVMAYNAGTNTWTQLGTGFVSAGQATYNALATGNDGNLVLAYADSTLGKIVARTCTVTDTPPATPVTGVTVTTQNNAPATITTTNGTLQLTAAVTPAEASQAVTWSIISGSAFATIDANGVVTATANGTVTVRATSVADATKFGELTVTVNIPPACPSLTDLYENFDTLSCCAMGVVPTCWTSILLGGASQIISSTQPASGTSQIYQNGYGAGKISIVILPQFSNVNAGTHRFRFKAKANGGPGTLEFGYITNIDDATTFVVIQSMSISNSSYTSTEAERTFTVPATVPADARLAIRNPGTTWAGMYWDDVYWEPIPATVQIATQDNAPATITTNGGTLQLVATVTPVAQAVTWTISNGTGLATIDANGLVTAIANGTITVTATTAGGATDTFDVVITNQAVLATAIEISTLNNVAAIITTNAGTLQLVATITPANTTDTTVTWSITAGTGLATIDANGLVTAIANGTITVTATTANGLTDTFEVVITNQTINVTAITISTENDVPATITTAAGTLQLIATLTPADATDTTVTWSITEGSEFATIDANGMVTAIANGTITITATSANGVTDTFTVVINILTTGLTDVNVANFSVYPNPTSGLLNISANQEITDFTVYNNLGQQVTVGKGLQINLQGVQNGMYLVQVTFKSGAGKTVKVIKQ